MTMSWPYNDSLLCLSVESLSFVSILASYHVFWLYIATVLSRIMLCS